MTPETAADLENGGAAVAVDLPAFDTVLVLVDGRPVLAKLQGVIRDADGRLVPLYDGGTR